MSEKTFPTVTPYLHLKDAAKAIQFYKDVLGAKEDSRIDRPDGKIMHAQLTIGSSVIMLTDECPERGVTAPSGSNPITLYVMVDNADTTFQKAKDKGAKIMMEPQDMFYGHRVASFMDLDGHQWSVGQLIEQVSPDELKKRAAKMYQDKAA